MNEAIFDGPNHEYRYFLTRDLNLEVTKVVTFLMLNPSTADEIDNDPTVARCVKYAIRWGFDKLIVTNVYAYRATDPKVLAIYPQPVGPQNDKYIGSAFLQSDLIIAAWGGNLLKDGPERIKKIKQMAIGAGKDIYCLKINQDGNPAHPLYLKSKSQFHKLRVCE